MNLLRDPIFLCEMRNEGGVRRQLSLPGVLSELAGGRIASFPKLRPTQAPYFHMFACQLAAMALDKAGRKFSADIDEATWTSLILALTPDSPTAFDLVQADKSLPAFLQPPVVEGSKDGKEPSIHVTPDEIDLVGTTRAHAQKRGFAGAEPEHWIHALICRQTAGGYAGKNNFGVMRAPGNHHPRYLVSLIPSACPSARFQRDVAGLLATKSEVLSAAPFLDASHGTPLLWTLPWDGDAQLNPSMVGPWSIEIAMRLRLIDTPDGLACERRLSNGRRISEGTQKSLSLLGRMGDPWAPIYVPSNCAANLEGGRPTFEWMARLVFDSSVYQLPVLAKRIPDVDGDQPRWLRIEGIHTKDGKTSWCEKTLAIPSRARFSFDAVKTPVVLDMLADIGLAHQQVLMPAMMAYFEDDDLSQGQQAEARRDFYPTIRESFSFHAEDAFFASAAEAASDPEGSLARWRTCAAESMEKAYEAFLESVPGRENASRRKRARGVGALRALLVKNWPGGSVSFQGKIMTTNTRRADIETASNAILKLVTNANVIPLSQFTQIESFDVQGLEVRIPTAFWKVLGQALPASMQSELEGAERLAWLAVVKAAATLSKIGGAPMAFGHALKEANVSQIRYDHIMQPADDEDRRLTLDSTLRMMGDKGVAFYLKDVAFQLLLKGQDLTNELERIDRDFVRADMGKAA